MIEVSFSGGVFVPALAFDVDVTGAALDRKDRGASREQRAGDVDGRLDKAAACWDLLLLLLLLEKEKERMRE